MRDEASRFGSSSFVTSERVRVVLSIGLAMIGVIVFPLALAVGATLALLAWWYLRRSWYPGVPALFRVEGDTLEIGWPGGERERIPMVDIASVSTGRVFGPALYRPAAGASRVLYWFRF